MEKKTVSEATLSVDSKSRFDFISKYKYNTLVGCVPRNSPVDISKGANHTIKITGPETEVKETKRRVEGIVGNVKSSKFIISVEANRQLVSAVKDRVTRQTQCIVEIESMSAAASRERPMMLLDEGMDPPAVTVVISEIQQLKADVIVNTTHKNLTLGLGLVSTALLKVCGSGVQEELRQEYPDGIENGEVAITGPGDSTSCRAIYHGALPFWKGLQPVSMDQCYIALVSLIYRCLINASSTSYTSIAFPAFGTGQLEYPAVCVVKLMNRAVSVFLRENPYTSLQNVYFVLHPGTSLEMKQYFMAYSVTRSTPCVQIDSTSELHAKHRASCIDTFEMLFRVGKTLVQVLNADVKEACNSTSPVLVLWRPEEIPDPSSNRTLKCLCPGTPNSEQLRPLVENLHNAKAVSDTASTKSRTLIHCYCVSEKDTDVTAAIQSGLEQAQKHCSQTVTIPVPSDSRLGKKPVSTAEAVLKTVKKCSSHVYAVVVVIPGSQVFMPFVSKATEMHKPLEATQLDTNTLAEKTWSESFAEWSKVKADEGFRKRNNSVLTVTSDSEETNKQVAMEIKKMLSSQQTAH